MFVDCARRIMDSGLTGADLAVCLAVWSFADDGGKAWPSTMSIARRAGLKVGGREASVERSCRRILARLKDAGLLTECGWSKHHTVILQLHLDRLPEYVEPGTEDTGLEALGAGQPGTQEPGTGEPGTLEPGTLGRQPGTAGTGQPGTREPAEPVKEPVIEPVSISSDPLAGESDPPSAGLPNGVEPAAGTAATDTGTPSPETDSGSGEGSSSTRDMFPRSTTLPPEAIRWLALIERWSNGEAPKNRRWKVDAKADLDWFLLQCLPKAPPGVDVLAELARVDNWLEGQARAPNGGKFWKNIGGVKNGLNRWLSTAKPSKPVQVQASGGNGIDPEALWDSLPRLMLAYGVDFIEHADGPPERLRAAVEALGGPRALCAMADRERSFHRKQFVAVYRGAH